MFVRSTIYLSESLKNFLTKVKINDPNGITVKIKTNLPVK